MSGEGGEKPKRGWPKPAQPARRKARPAAQRMAPMRPRQFRATECRVVSEDVRFVGLREVAPDRWAMLVSLEVRVRTPGGVEVVVMGGHEFPGVPPSMVIPGPPEDEASGR